MCVFVCVCGGGGACVCVGGGKLLVCLSCNFCAMNNYPLSFKYKMCVILYCDVVNVEPRLNFSVEIIK